MVFAYGCLNRTDSHLKLSSHKVLWIDSRANHFQNQRKRVAARNIGDRGVFKSATGKPMNAIAMMVLSADVGVPKVGKTIDS